jgi:hypothetical protein
MQIAQLLQPLRFGKHVEVMIAVHPEGLAVLLHRHGKFDGLHGSGERSEFRFAQEKMNMLRHDDVTVKDEVVAEAHSFERCFEE